MKQVKPYTKQAADISFMRVLHTALSSYMTQRTGDTNIRLTEAISKDDPRAKGPRMRKAIRSEVRDLMRCSAFRAILKRELSDGANTLTARFILAIKSTDDVITKYKARYVIGGHCDHLIHNLMHNAQTLRPMSIRLLLAIT